jgi:prophage antirepressor-like protein
MNNLVTKSFNQNEITVINKNSEAWFIASDISKALNYATAKDLTRILDDDEKGRHTVPTPSGEQEKLIINESGLYHALFKSRKKEAVAFRKWVTSEVLPSIRKTGKYESEALQQKLDDANDKIKQLESENEKVTPAMKAHMHKLVKAHVNKTKRSHSSVWHEANRHAGASKMDDVLKENYPHFCQFFNAEPIEGEFIPKQTNLLIPLKEEIEKDISDYPGELNVSHVYNGRTRSNRIFRILEKQGINVDMAKKEYRCMADNLHQLQHANNVLVEQITSFKRHCRELISVFKHYDTRFQLFDHETNLSTKWCSKNLSDKWMVV